jgi:hypothetical protein
VCSAWVRSGCSAWLDAELVHKVPGACMASEALERLGLAVGYAGGVVDGLSVVVVRE